MSIVSRNFQEPKSRVDVSRNSKREKRMTEKWTQKKEHRKKNTEKRREKRNPFLRMRIFDALFKPFYAHLRFYSLILLYYILIITYIYIWMLKIFLFFSLQKPVDVDVTTFNSGGSLTNISYESVVRGICFW